MFLGILFAKRFLWFVLSCATLIAGLGSKASATEVFKFGYILSSQSQLGQGAATFASEVEKRTNGRYTIKLYPDAMLGGEVEMLKGIQLGTIDLAFITGAALPKVVPEVGVFNIPFLFSGAPDARALLDGPMGEEYLRKFDRVGIAALAWGENGMRELTTSNRLVRTPGDVVGLRLRLPQSDVMAAGFAALGANVQQMPFPEVYAALQNGRVDGEENPIATILSSRFSQVQSVLILTDHVYDPAVVLMSKDSFDEMSEEDRDAFRMAARSAARRSREAASEAEAGGIAMMRKGGRGGIGDVGRAAFAKKVEATLPYFDAQFGHEVVERIRASRATLSPGSAQSEASRP